MTLVAVPARAETPAADEAPPLTIGGRPSPERQEWLARVEESRQNYEVFARQAVLDMTERAPRPPAISTGRIEDFLTDSTLQRGDVVVTDQGFRIFRGSASAAETRDFKPLAVGDSRRRFSRVLRELEKASGPAR